MRLHNIGSLLPYHSHVDTGTVVNALNHMNDDVSNGKTVFYEFYTAGSRVATVPPDPVRYLSTKALNPCVLITTA